MFNMQRILVPVDFSPESDLALQWAVRAAKEENLALIMVCHVLPPKIIVGGAETVGIDYEAVYEDEEKAVRRKLGSLLNKIPPDIGFTSVVVRGKIANEIQKLCETKSIDLVVMTTHGRKGLSHFLHGSTTEETTRLAPCPVLVLHLNRKISQPVAAQTDTLEEDTYD